MLVRLFFRHFFWVQKYLFEFKELNFGLLWINNNAFLFFVRSPELSWSLCWSVEVERRPSRASRQGKQRPRLGINHTTDLKVVHRLKRHKSRTKAREGSLTAAVNHREKGVKIQSQSKCLSFSWSALNNSAEVAASLSSAETFRNLGATSSKDSFSPFLFAAASKTLEEQVALGSTKSGFVDEHVKQLHKNMH